MFELFMNNAVLPTYEYICTNTLLSIVFVYLTVVIILTSYSLNMYSSSTYHKFPWTYDLILILLWPILLVLWVIISIKRRIFKE